MAKASIEIYESPAKNKAVKILGSTVSILGLTAVNFTTPLYSRYKFDNGSNGKSTNNELELMNGYWRAYNYLSVAMIYLKANPLLDESSVP